MSAINYQELVSSIMNRTQHNFNTIKNSRSAHEVTQLLNSLWGFVVYPYEYFSTVFNKDNKNDLIKNQKTQKHVNSIKQIVKECYENNKFFTTYPRLSKRNIDDWDLKEIFEFIKHIRNSISHSGNDCLLIKCSVVDNSIISIIFKDVHHNDKRIFCIEMDVDKTLPSFINNTVEIFKSMEKYYDHYCKFESNNINEIECLNNLMITRCVDEYWNNKKSEK